MIPAKNNSPVLFARGGNYAAQLAAISQPIESMKAV